MQSEILYIFICKFNENFFNLVNSNAKCDRNKNSTDVLMYHIPGVINNSTWFSIIPVGNKTRNTQTKEKT